MPSRVWWACCGNKRLDRRAEPDLKPRLVSNAVNYARTSLRVLILMHALILGVWCVFSIVPGFAYYDGPTNVYNPVSNTGFWLAIEFITVLVGSFAVSYELVPMARGPALDAASTVRKLTFWIVVLVVALAANIAHIVASGIEMSNGDSTLAMTESGFLIGLFVILGLVVLLECIELVYIGKYRLYLRWASLVEHDVLQNALRASDNRRNRKQ